LAVPLRHYLYPGDVLWTEEGMRFAWKVMLREKHGSVTFHVHFPETDKRLQVPPGQYLVPRQEREMASQPDLILQLAHHIADDFRARGYGRVEVRVEALVSLNGRPAQAMIDPKRDLAAVSFGLAPSDWILPAPSSDPIKLRAHARR
ncbi:MAG: HTTM domain-containing protein, partial [Myxococcota bacterium]